MIQRLLRNYENSDIVIRLKARFLLYLLLLVIIFTPFVIFYSAYLQKIDPAYNYTINWPAIMPPILLFFFMLGTLFLLFRGHFILSAHITAIIVFASIWTVIFIDQSETIKKLDTTLLIIGFFSAVPILISKKKYMALVYGAANLILLCVFILYLRYTMNLSDSTIAEYLSENTVALLFATIMAYNILSINTRALDHAGKSNTDLNRKNMELQAAMEELSASNEEYEAQNEELARSEEALQKSEDDLLSIFNSVHDALIVYDLSGKILNVNERMLEMFRIDRIKVLSLNISDLSSTPFDIESVRTLWKKVVDGKDSLFEWEVRRPGDDSTFYTEVGLKGLRHRGKTELLAVIRDISARKEAENALKESLQEKIVLIREIHHRVKNNMQVISSLLNMQADSIAEFAASEALRDAVGRIHSMASIHEKIYRTENFSNIDMSSYIEELSGDLVSIHSGKGGEIRINRRMSPVYLGVDMAIPCGLLINEIFTNAIKHGNSGMNDCVIDLELKESDGTVTIAIADNGPGMDPKLFESQRKTSMGMQIIDALARQIGATVTLSIDGGTRFTIKFPVLK